MYRIKIIPLAIILILFSSATQAQESEGLIQKAYKKFILKEKVAEKKPISDTENTNTSREKVVDGINTTVVKDFYKNMSKTAIIQEIKNEVDSEEGILEQIPELKRQKDKDGKNVYSYLVEGKQVILEDADENILRSLIEQVDVKAKQFREDAFMEQQEQMRFIRSINAVQHPPQAPSRPTTAPQRPPTPPRR